MSHKVSGLDAAWRAIAPHSYDLPIRYACKLISLFVSTCLEIYTAIRIYKTGFSRENALFALLGLVPVAVSSVRNYIRGPNSLYELLKHQFSKPELSNAPFVDVVLEMITKRIPKDVTCEEDPFFMGTPNHRK